MNFFTSPKAVIIHLGLNVESSIFKLSNVIEANIYSLERRYFGESFPFDELSSENLVYLTVDQILADVANFIKKIILVSPEKYPIVIVGGGIDGSFGSWFRLKYPHFVAASWASSSPILSKFNFSDFDDIAFQALQNVSRLCGENTKKALDFLQLNLTHNSKKTKEMFNFPIDDNDTSFLFVVSEVISYCVQNDCKNILDDHCKLIESQRIEDLNETFWNIVNSQDLDWRTFDPLYPKNLTKSDARSWAWLTCHQLGFFRTSSSLRPSNISFDYFKKACREVFPVVNFTFDENDFNLIFGGKNPHSTEIYFTNGERDPWSSLSILSPIDASDIHATVIKKGYHCQDLTIATDETNDVLQFLKNAVQFWNQSLCVNGERILNKCLCDNYSYGKFCSTSGFPQKYLNYLTFLSVFCPTIILLVITTSLWYCAKKNDCEPISLRSSFLLYT